MGRRSVFLEARKTAGRTGKPCVSILDMIEERQSRCSRVTRRPSNEVDIDGVKASTLEFDLDAVSREFPMETLWYNEKDEDKRLEDYKKFKEMSNILSSMRDCGGNLKNRTLQADADLIRSMYKIYADESPVPRWLKNGMSRIHNDKNFQDYARDYWEEMGEEADIVDFDDLDEEQKVTQRRRRSCMVSSFTQDAISACDANSMKSIALDVDTRDTRRASLTKTEETKNASRRASMLVCSDMKMMKKMDSRRQSIVPGESDIDAETRMMGGAQSSRAQSRRASMAKAGNIAMAATKWTSAVKH